ncbi:MAG: IS630 family transposase [Beijerinckiaceae bacterium]
MTIAVVTDGLAARGLKVHPASVGRFLHREGKSFKKNRASRRTRDKAQAGTPPRAMEALSGRIDPARLVFLNETWVKTNMTPLRDWGDRSKRLIAHVPHAHWKTMTFIAALRIDRIDAPWVIDGPINGDAFRTYVEKELLQTLQPGDVVVLDNLGSHKGKAVRQMVRAAGARLFFLPPYSPDLNPIEQLFSKIKHAMRKAMGRSVEAIQHALKVILQAIPKHECVNYIANAGYKST